MMWVLHNLVLDPQSANNNHGQSIGDQLSRTMIDTEMAAVQCTSYNELSGVIKLCSEGLVSWFCLLLASSRLCC